MTRETAAGRTVTEAADGHPAGCWRCGTPGTYICDACVIAVMATGRDPRDERDYA